MPRESRKPAEAPAPRVHALAKLPVFLDLAGKRAIIAGGTAPAAWKAELLAAAGADVHIYSAEVSPEMQAFVARGAAAGSVTLHRCPWSVDCLTGAAVALADAACEAEAKAFACAARAAGVPVNVIDKPSFCQFQFGSIVNRSPVVIGISTDGGAPILGQVIRRRIETLLPPTLADWGRYAKAIRNEVSARLKPGPERRAFWERFAEAAFGGRLPRRETLDVDIVEAQRGAPATGCVTLVGAGPGDPELLTIKALRALQSADIILYDDLVADGVLELARREAKRMMVGKRGRRESCAQGDINALMLKLARQGKHVVRLKSGDPMIFGRAGEEIADLEAAGIPVTVVSGITAGVALAAELGVSLTHRAAAQSVRFVTGHSRYGELPELDWKGLADPTTTLVLYMAGGTAGEIATRLIEQGLSRDLPAVAASGIGRPETQRWQGTLHDLTVWQPFQDGQPILIGIGRVFDPSAIRCRAHAAEAA